MDKNPKFGTSINSLRLSRIRVTTSHSISLTQVNLITSRFGQPTQDGGNSLPMKVNSFPMSKTTRFLMLMETKTRNTETFICIRDITVQTRDGRSSMLIKLKLVSQRVWMRNSVSTETDHFTLDLDFHSRELFNVTVLTISI
jgi:hypothetical protein